jgi:hypothetical protein
MIGFITHEATHSRALPFPEIWNEPIATYVGNLVMIDMGYAAEGQRRIKDVIARAAKIGSDDEALRQERHEQFGRAAARGGARLQRGSGEVDAASQTLTRGAAASAGVGRRRPTGPPPASRCPVQRRLATAVRPHAM